MKIGVTSIVPLTTTLQRDGSGVGWDGVGLAQRGERTEKEKEASQRRERRERKEKEGLAGKARRKTSANEAGLVRHEMCM